MEEQLNKSTQNPNKKRRSRAGIILLGFIVLAGAVLLVHHFVFSTKKNDDDLKPNQAKVAVIRITDQGFEPSTLAVPVGTRIVWTNAGQAMRQIASNPYPRNDSLPNLKSEILNNNQSYSYNARTVGTFDYHDQLQPTVNGTLIVEKQ